MDKSLNASGDKNQRDERLQLVCFTLNHEEYGVEVLKVKEIIRIAEITRVPNVPEFVAGVFNLRGKVIPIISLRKRFMLPDSEKDSKTRVIVIEMASELAGIMVDSVAEVIRISADEIQPAPAVATNNIDQEIITGLINRDNSLLVLLNLEKMLSAEERHLLSGTA